MRFKNLISPLYRLPYNYQVNLLNFFVYFFSILPFSKIINYKNYSLKLINKDKSSCSIYIGYLIHGKWNHEIFEQEIIESLILKKDKVYFVDVGASYGMFTFLAANSGNVKKIISIEAYKPVFECLKSNIEYNDINNIELINKVVSDSVDDFYEIQEFKNSEWNQFSKSSKMCEGVVSITLDEIIDKYIGETNDLILIKMDIEGNEPLAMNGLKKLELNVNIMLEFHVGVLEKIEGRAYEFAEKILSMKDFQIYIMHVGMKKLIPILSKEYFFNLISDMKKQEFPNNLFNILILKADNTHLIDEYIGEIS